MLNRKVSGIKSLLNDLVDFVYPKTSIISGKKLESESSNDYFTDEELLTLSRITPKDKEDLSFKVIADHSFSLFAFYHDDDFSKIIHSLKYGGKKQLGVYLGKLLGAELKKFIVESEIAKFDYVIPVPLFSTKLRERGYNQSDQICKGICSGMDIEFRKDFVKRIRHTKTQTRLNREQRMDNISNAFKINVDFAEELSGKRIIIIDDVVTTGSTINEMTKVIKEQTCSAVMACTLAMARD